MNNIINILSTFCSVIHTRCGGFFCTAVRMSSLLFRDTFFCGYWGQLGCRDPDDVVRLNILLLHPLVGSRAFFSSSITEWKSVASGPAGIVAPPRSRWMAGLSHLQACSARVRCSRSSEVRGGGEIPCAGRHGGGDGRSRPFPCRFVT